MAPYCCGVAEAVLYVIITLVINNIYHYDMIPHKKYKRRKKRKLTRRGVGKQMEPNHQEGSVGSFS
jgi:hypothetical protein